MITGDLDALAGHADTVTAVGTDFADTGSRVDGTWQELAAVYRAPEANSLFAATGPVRSVSAEVGTDLGTVGGALATYAGTVSGIKARLEALRSSAQTFVAEARADEDWRSDEGLVDEHNGLLTDVNAAIADFTEAQRTCANAILALYTDRRWTAENGDGTIGENEFGYGAAQLDAALEQDGALPWGTSEEHDRGFWGDVGAFFGGIGQGAVDTVTGLGALIGYADGEWSWGTAGSAWAGLGIFVGAVFVYGNPLTSALDQTIGLFGQERGYFGDTLLNAGKAIIAYDTWGEDPQRAAGMTTFNVVSAIIGTKGAGAALRGTGAAVQGSRVAVVARGGQLLVRAGTAIGRIPTVEDLVGAVRNRFTGLAVPDIDAPDIDVPTEHVDTPRPRDLDVEVPNVDAPDVRPDGVSVQDALRGPDRPGVDTVDRPGAATDGPGTGRPDADAPNRPDTVDRPGAATDGPGTGRPDPDRPAANGPDAPDRPGVDTVDRPGADTDVPGTGRPDPDGVDAHRPDADGPDADGPGADGPDTQRPDTNGPDANRPDANTPDADAPDADRPDADSPDAEQPLGTQPDGSWVGREHGVTLHLDREANELADGALTRAADAERTITPQIQEIVDGVPGAQTQGLEFVLKGEDSLRRKLAGDLYENPTLTPTEAVAGVRDSVRYTMEIPPENYVDGVTRATDQLVARGFEPVTFKPSWSDPNVYRGLNSTWRDPATGQVFELQFHTPASFAAKMVTHDLYEAARVPGVPADEVARLHREQAEVFASVPEPPGAARLTELRETVLAHADQGAPGARGGGGGGFVPGDAGPTPDSGGGGSGGGTGGGGGGGTGFGDDSPGAPDPDPDGAGGGGDGPDAGNGTGGPDPDPAGDAPDPDAADEPIIGPDGERYGTANSSEPPTAAQIADTLGDTNPRFPITEDNAAALLSDGPPGTRPVVAASGGAGADVRFVDPDGNTVLSREHKSTSGSYSSFNSQLSHAANDQAHLRGEVWFQVAPGTDVARHISRFMGSRTPERRAEYADLTVVFHDSDGVALGRYALRDWMG